MLHGMTSVFMDPDAVDSLSATLFDVASDLDARASVIEGLLVEAGKSSPAPAEARASAELLVVVSDDMARRAQVLRDADSLGWLGVLRDFFLGDVVNFWRGDDGTMPWGRAVAGGVRTWRGAGYLSRYWQARLPGRTVRRPPAPTTANGGMAQFIARRLGPKAVQVLDSNLVAGLPDARNANLLARGQGGWRTLAPRAGVVRGVGVVGGLASTGMGIADLVSQGNPVDAFEEGGAEYAADWAETLFSASSTALFVAPTPVTAVATVVTGVAWVGLEAWNHREEVAEVWDGAVDAVGDFGAGAVDVAGDVVSSLNPFD